MKLTRSEILPAVEKINRNSTLAIGILAGVYFLAARLALSLANYHDNATTVWVGSGIALAVLLLRGTGLWPGIFLGAFSANFMIAGSVYTSLAIAAGYTLDAVVGAWLVRRFARGEDALERTHDVLKFALFGGLLSTAISATIAVTSLTLEGFAEWNSYKWVWMTWWMGSATGVVLVAPLILLWRSSPRLNWRRFVEVVILVSSVIAVSATVFGGLLLKGRSYPLEYFCIPFLVWAAFRFGRRGAVSAMLALSAAAIVGTLNGTGPFAGESPRVAQLLLQSFLGVCAVMTLALAAEVRQRRRAERAAHALAVSDPVTGLGNYRRLVDALEHEIKRSERTSRPFAFVFFDLDDLKKINDIHGHLVGTRALCRCADILRLNTRTVDTVARYGGDEFAVILSETDRDGGRQLASRIASLLAADGEKPLISVSFGVAMWPNDGRTTETLFRAADNALYEMKRGRGGVQVTA
ncbi:MAG TPA: MASE1 domain-containing protein [Terriglobia bacterium]|nr:MASE1 domain-containing protein [Terriglobia bacterium]